MGFIPRIVIAVFPGLIFLCPDAFSSDLPPSRSGVVLIAPLYISNDQISSALDLCNGTDSRIEANVILDSLEGEEIARTTVTLAPRSTVHMDVGSIPMVRHRFPDLGSLSVAALALTDKAFTGELAIMSRAEAGKVNLVEHLQPLPDRYPGSFQVGVVPKSFSAPVIAVHSLSSLPQGISVTCSDDLGASYESQFRLPAHLTLLVNACVRGKSENRTYRELLSGDTGPMRPKSIIRIGAEEGISVWGFAVSSSGTPAGLRVQGIEFKKW